MMHGLANVKFMNRMFASLFFVLLFRRLLKLSTIEALSDITMDHLSTAV
jgi:hypothetical protein